MKAKYGIIKDEQLRDLLRVPHQGKNLIVSYSAFGPNQFSKNIKEMQKQYTHPITKKQISFREPTTAESISASVYKFGDMAKPEILNKRWFQVGRIVNTIEGVFANPPKNKQGNPVIDEHILKQYLNKAKKVHGIYIVPNGEFKGLRDFGFAPYESFLDGGQFGKEFAVNIKTNGLARVLEHTENKVALGFKVISDQENYSRRVNAFNFDRASGLSLLTLGRDDCDDLLYVNGDAWGSAYDIGYAFGVCKDIETNK